MKLLHLLALVLVSHYIYAQDIPESYALNIVQGSYTLMIPASWTHGKEPDANLREITIVENQDGTAVLKILSMPSPGIVTPELLRNMTNVSVSIRLELQTWGDLSGYQYQYSEDDSLFMQWWMMDQKQLVFFVYEANSQSDSDKEVIEAMVTSITSAN